jgi:hypothetical protein
MDILGTYKDEPVILQSKPQRRTIFCTHFDGYGYNVETYFLQFPYIVSCKYPFDNYSYLRVGFSPEPISSLDAKIYLPPLPNTHYCGTFAVCGCEGDIKTSIQQFWQKKFKTGELFSGEILLCKMFNKLHTELGVHTLLRQWEKLDLVSFNECITNITNTNDVVANVSVSEFLELSFKSIQLMF